MDDRLETDVPLLLKEAGYSTANISWVRLLGGRNNRAYRVDTPDGPVLLKQYYQGGEWDRMGAESRFMLFCAKYGVARVPRLLAGNANKGLALHSWISGGRPAPDSIAAGDIEETVTFLGELDAASRKCDLSRIPPARDAALCLEDFFRSPRERLAQLHEALLTDPDESTAAEALAFYEKELWPAWNRASENGYAKLASRDRTRPFPMDELFVSPSDIGFHNALRRDGGGLAFLDFEYAGLDSPIKTAGDFSCQMDFSLAVGAVEVMLPAEWRGGRFAEVLYPLFVIKFCCIALNEFKAPDGARRDFSLASAVHLREQLEKSRNILGGLTI